MTRHDNQLDSADPGLYAEEPPEMGDDDSLVAMVEGLARHEDEQVENDMISMDDILQFGTNKLGVTYVVIRDVSGDPVTYFEPVSHGKVLDKMFDFILHGAA